MFNPLYTIFVKLPWLVATGQKSKLDADVFGVPKAIEQKKR